MDTVTDFRDFTGWVHHALVNRQAELAKSHLPLDEEYWLALRHPAETYAAGVALISQQAIGFSTLAAGDQERVWREFRAYVRQAEGFYRGASVLPWKSSPLNYYYSFMNLAKAMAIVRGVLAAPGGGPMRRLRHGLSADVVSGTPDVWKLAVQSPADVFSVLYQMSIGTAAPQGTVLDARDLLTYVSAIGWQLSKSGYGRRWYASYWLVVGSEKEFWDVLVVPRGLDLSRLPPAFSVDYEEVAGDKVKGFAMRLLNLHAVEASSFRFLQRKVPFVSAQPNAWDVGVIDQALRTAAPNCVFEQLTGGDMHICISEPCPATPATIPMNELVAAYAITYFLSSLVRYHPDYIDRIAESNDAWLIESFAKAAPLLLLRQLTAAVLGYTLIIEPA